MSSRSRASRTSEEEMSELICKLQSMLPETRRRRSTNKASADKLLKDTCSYIKSLNQEVEDLSHRICELMSSMELNSEQAEVVRSLLSSSSSDGH